jgi:acyl dehydratase
VRPEHAGRVTVQQIEQAPKLSRLYASAAVTARGRHGDRLPEVIYQLSDLSIDRTNLASYADVCGFRQSDVLPPTYPHILGFPAAIMLMVDRKFPFPLPGLVHINNRITQKRAIRADERLTVCVKAANLREHPRGRQFDMTTEVTIAGEAVWSEISTYLRREKSSSPRPSPAGGAQASTPSPVAGEGRGGGPPTSIWRIPRNTGRRYAAVSGDVNPIHLNPLAARLFGFPRAIAHGMWVKAHCLAALEGRLPDALTAEVEFKSPLLLPSTVAFSGRPDNGGWSIAVGQPRSVRTHLLGHVHGQRAT